MLVHIGTHGAKLCLLSSMTSEHCGGGLLKLYFYNQAVATAFRRASVITQITWWSGIDIVMVIFQYIW
jgi:hypothetical protein